MRIAITDCDHAEVAEELEVCRADRIELTRHTATAEAAVAEQCAGADALLVQYAPITAAVLDALPSVKAISRYGVGVDTVDIPACTARGVAVLNVPDYGTEAVSDHALALILDLLRRVTQGDRNIRAGHYDFALATPVFQSSGRRLGLVGLGAIGEALARKARGIGMAVVGCDPRFEPGTVSPGGTSVVGLEEVLGSSSIVSLHAPLTKATRHLIDADTLALMRPDAYLVNTARGGLVDTEALVEALRAGRILGAGLDVLETEPLPAGHPLTELANVVLTPHSAFYSEESFGELKRRTARGAADVLMGRTPRNCLNPEVLA
ncbi:MAG: C-terminal binding protein [Actinomycetaceae bacterium]|nr:C-terminal binding protein [Actinomycetaceae bacterium]